MNLLCFTNKKNITCEQIIHNLIHTFPDLNINMLPTLKKLETQLRQKNFFGNTIVLFMIDSKREFKKIFLFKELLANINVVLILPNEKEMFRIGARLYPRFMTDFDNAPYEIEPILYKLIEKYKRQ